MLSGPASRVAGSVRVWKARPRKWKERPRDAKSIQKEERATISSEHEQMATTVPTMHDDYEV
jgi:hypothetical protein